MIKEIKKMLIKLDRNGFFENYEEQIIKINTETNEIVYIPKNYQLFSWINQDSTVAWIKPKFDHELNKWVEGATKEEIEEDNIKDNKEDLNKILAKQVNMLILNNKKIKEINKQLVTTVANLNIKIKKMEGDEN